ncbi:MAG TPA: SMC-Scp complex subunit ScpB [Bacteroidota bacterium]|nr:SMC-Scp complex subunit ScpB [Bacteroidota bacterium]
MDHPEPAPDRAKIIEALIFASDEPLTTRQISEILRSAENGGIPIRAREEDILAAIRELNGAYVRDGRSFRIIQVAGGFQYATMPAYAGWLGRMVKEKARRKLTQATIETLSVIAYKQPVTKPEIEAIRGVNADYGIQKLMERGLVTIVGRAASAGRPLLYGTTGDFLKHFGLNDLSELPRPREIDEILADNGFELERELMKRMGKSEEEIEKTMADSIAGTTVGENGELHPPPPGGDTGGVSPPPGEAAPDTDTDS